MTENQITDEDLQECRLLIARCKEEAKKRIIGQEYLIDGIIKAFITGGHILLEGVPGLAKTLAVKTFAEISGLDFKRIQFTPDLLPADISGTLIYEQEKSSFSVRKGPIFSNIVLADEINRAPAKVHSAMLEAMEEHQVTIGEDTYKLPKPFFVLASQNPIEQEGTYNLPEAELDRFTFKINAVYPTLQEEAKIIQTEGNAQNIPVNQILSCKDIIKFNKILSAVVYDPKLVEYIVKIISITRPVKTKDMRHDITRCIAFGASPRAGISLIKCAKAQAITEGRSFVLPEDIKNNTLIVLRHRIVLSYEAAADGITADEIIEKIIDTVEIP